VQSNETFRSELREERGENQGQLELCSGSFLNSSEVVSPRDEPKPLAEVVQKGANVILNGAKRSEESPLLNQILRPTWEAVGLRMTFWST